MLGGKLKSYFLVGVMLLAIFASPAPSARASTQNCLTISDLFARQSCLVTQSNAIKASLSANRQTATTLQQAINSLDSNISDIQSQINNTNEQIATTQAIIAKLASQITDTQSQLDGLNTKLNTAYANLYEMSQTNTIELVFQSNSINDLLSQSQYIESLQTSLLAQIDQANKLKKSLQGQKSQSEQQQANLQSLNNQLAGSRDALVGQQNQKQRLLNTAQANVSNDLASYNDVQQKIAAVTKQIAALAAGKFGTNIVSSYNPSWYYSQFNYPGTYLGSSPYSLYYFGCLVTSYAMVATYYGHHVTPPQIANTNSNFDGYGDLIVQPPAPTGLHGSSSYPVNWGTVNAQLDSGHPVIVSVYLPSVGAINGDGSSHFIVLWGRSGSTYLMQDPIASSGRGYSLSQVRSMKIITP